MLKCVRVGPCANRELRHLAWDRFVDSVLSLSHSAKNRVLAERAAHCIGIGRSHHVRAVNEKTKQNAMAVFQTLRKTIETKEEFCLANESRSDLYCSATEAKSSF